MIASTSSLGFFLSVLTLTVSLNADAIDVSCKNELTDEELDYFMMYKLPKLKYAGDNMPMVKNGTAYSYMTDEKPEWSLSDISINSTQSMSGKTLAPLYQKEKEDRNDSFGYVLYNDQADNLNVTFVKGHSKGVIMFNSTDVVWLLHSIPHFPPSPRSSSKSAEYLIHPGQVHYGQSLLCLSLRFAQLADIGAQLLYVDPQVYDSAIPARMQNSPELAYLISIIQNGKTNTNDVTPPNKPWFSVRPMKTRRGEQLLSFAKHAKFDDDLYAGLIAPSFESDLLVETWNNGQGTLPSSCNSTYHVKNIERLEFAFSNNTKNKSISFSVHSDHSKWTVTDSPSSKHSKIACIGDINRQQDQFVRGGGVICFVENASVWKQYHALVQSNDVC